MLRVSKDAGLICGDLQYREMRTVYHHLFLWSWCTVPKVKRLSMQSYSGWNDLFTLPVNQSYFVPLCILIHWVIF